MPANKKVTPAIPPAFDPDQASGFSDTYRKAVAAVLTANRPTGSFIQTKLSIGYQRAARLIEQMEADGIVSKLATTPLGGRARKVLVTRAEWDRRQFGKHVIAPLVKSVLQEARDKFRESCSSQPPEPAVPVVDPKTTPVYWFNEYHSGIKDFDIDRIFEARAQLRAFGYEIAYRRPEPKS